MTQSTTIEQLLAPHSTAFADQNLTAGVAVVSGTTENGTCITTSTQIVEGVVHFNQATNNVEGVGSIMEQALVAIAGQFEE